MTISNKHRDVKENNAVSEQIDYDTQDDEEVVEINIKKITVDADFILRKRIELQFASLIAANKAHFINDWHEHDPEIDTALQSCLPEAVNYLPDYSNAPDRWERVMRVAAGLYYSKHYKAQHLALVYWNKYRTDKGMCPLTQGELKRELYVNMLHDYFGSTAPLSADELISLAISNGFDVSLHLELRNIMNERSMAERQQQTGDAHKPSPISRDLMLVYEAMVPGQKYAMKQLAELTGLSVKQCRSRVDVLRSEGKIIKEGEDRNTVYFRADGAIRTMETPPNIFPSVGKWSL